MDDLPLVAIGFELAGTVRLSPTGRLRFAQPDC
jgi:hypothetical protein